MATCAVGLGLCGMCINARHALRVLASLRPQRRLTHGIPCRASTRDVTVRVPVTRRHHGGRSFSPTASMPCLHAAPRRLSITRPHGRTHDVACCLLRLGPWLVIGRSSPATGPSRCAHASRRMPCRRRRQVGPPPDGGCTPGVPAGNAPPRGALHAFRRTTVPTKPHETVPKAPSCHGSGAPGQGAARDSAGRSCVAPLGGHTAWEWHPHSTRQDSATPAHRAAVRPSMPPPRIGERPQ